MTSCAATSSMQQPRSRTGAVAIARREDISPSSPQDRLISKSHVPVSNMQSLDNHLPSMRHEGWLQLNQISAADEHSSRHARHADPAAAAGTVWLRYWFSLEDGHLHWFHYQKDAQKFRFGDEAAFVGSVPLERVVKISMSSENLDSLAITYQPHAEDEPAIIYNLRGRDRDDRNNWLHSFHCSVAWLVAAMTLKQLRGKSLLDGKSDRFRPTGRTHTLAQHDSPKHPRNKALRASDGFGLGGRGGRGGGGDGGGGGDDDYDDEYDDEYDDSPAAGAGGRSLGASLGPVHAATRQQQQMPWVVKERSVSGASLGSFKEASSESFLFRSSHGIGGGGSPPGSFGGGGASSDEQDHFFHNTMLERQLTIPRAASARREAQAQQQAQGQAGGLHSVDEREAFDLATDLDGLDDDTHDNHNRNHNNNNNSHHHRHHHHRRSR